MGSTYSLGSSTSKRASGKWLWLAIGIAIFAAVLLLAGCDVAGGTKTSIADALKSSSSESASSSSQTPLANAKITATTEYLEYSNKEVDPVTLVTCDNKDAAVTALSKIDLSSVGAQKVAYRTTVGDSVAGEEIEFIVRDTKAPVITLSENVQTIEQGGSFDPKSAIVSVVDEIDGDLDFTETQPEAKGSNIGTELFYEKGWFAFEGDVDSSIPGTYAIKVVANDKHGNASSKEITVTVTAPPVEEAAEEPAPAVFTYVANTNSHKFHIPSCSSAKQIKNSNRLEITCTRDEMISMGYEPCKRCNP